MLTLVFNDDAKNKISIANCTESLRTDRENGLVKEFTIQIVGKTLTDLQPLVKDLKIEKVEIFNGDESVFKSIDYCELVSVNNNISSDVASSGMYMMLRAN